MKNFALIVKSVLLFLAATALVFGTGWYAHKFYSSRFEQKKLRLVSAKGFRLTSPLLDVQFPEGMGVNFEPLPFKQKVESYVDQQIKSGLATDISVYYRDLLEGPWFGIHENKEFDPGSLMKVAVMIAWLKRAEIDPRVLQRVLTYNFPEDMRQLQSSLPARSVEPGKSYTVDELLKYMIMHSDNNAALMLYSSLTVSELLDVNLGTDVHNKRRGDSNSISVVGYAGFFRILHNASYLNRAMSEKALDLLAHNDFRQGIVAGVPAGTVVASKFGESLIGPDKKGFQLHEFGIVYHPTHRYILGVMTQGTDLNRMAQVIRGISKVVYEQVDAGTFTPDDKSR